MKFEVVNIQNKVVMSTEYEECVPNKEQCEHMLKAGYKFRLDNAILTKKKLDVFLKLIEENIGGENNK